MESYTVVFLNEDGSIDDIEISAPDLSSAYELADQMGLIIEEIFETDTAYFD